MNDSVEETKIIMDERERGKIRTSFRFLEKKKGYPIDLQIETMEFGDFIISPRIAIERKRGDDLVSSIFDNRFFKQLNQLARWFQYPILLLENPSLIFKRSSTPEASIYGALVYAAYKMGISVLPSADEQETAEIIYNLAKKEQKAGFYPQYPLNKTKIGGDFPNENEGELDEKKLKEEQKEDQIYFLEGLVQVGKKKAKKLLKYFGTPQYVLHAIKDTKVIYDSKGNAKKIDGLFSNIKGFGPKFIDRNKKLILSSQKKSKKKKRKTYS